MKITLKNISKSFNNKEVIHPCNIVIEDGKFTTLLGPSVCGKTTLLRIIAGLETFKQINIDYPKMINIEEKRSLPIDYIYGKSGHCVSSVWYLITINNKNILYTGDYIENTLVYKCDWIRNINADMAIIDCTYGYNNASYQQYCKTLETITNKLSNNSILFPVPKSGRGIELLKLFDKLNVNIFADDNFINSLNIDHWYNDAIFKHLVTKYTDQKGLIFISDPQLLKEES